MTIGVDVSGIESAICSRPLEDLLVAGFVEKLEGGLCRFYTDLKIIYLDLAGEYLLFEAEDCRIKVSLSDEAMNPRSIDEDDAPGVTSIWNLVMRYSLSNLRVRELRLYVGEDKLPQRVAIEVCCAEGVQVLFLDPYNTFGIWIGDERDEREWREGSGSASNMVQIRDSETGKSSKPNPDRFA